MSYQSLIFQGEGMREYFGGIEAGGTKFVCVIANDPNDILEEQRFPTSNPKETISKVLAFFKNAKDHHNIRLLSIGIGSFGPVDLNPSSRYYGFITSTPKPGWQFTNLVKPIQEGLKLSVAFDTDVNAAAIAEGKWGAAQNIDDFLYFTIGTGIGGGAIIHGKPLHGLIHPEMGHIYLVQNKEKDHYQGKCPFHKTCFEGLASGPAIEERWNLPGWQLDDNHPAWDLESDYIAQAMSNFICTFSPERIILGGGVMQRQHLYPMIRTKVQQYLNNYVVSDIITAGIDHYIVSPQLGNRAGMLGAIALAQSLC